MFEGAGNCGVVVNCRGPQISRQVKDGVDGDVKDKRNKQRLEELQDTPACVTLINIFLDSPAQTSNNEPFPQTRRPTDEAINLNTRTALPIAFIF